VSVLLGGACWKGVVASLLPFSFVAAVVLLRTDGSCCCVSFLVRCSIDRRKLATDLSVIWISSESKSEWSMVSGSTGPSFATEFAVRRFVAGGFTAPSSSSPPAALRAL
jgi:hypothetical protein